MESLIAIALALLIGLNNSPSQDIKNDKNDQYQQSRYNSSETRQHDLIHTDLSVSFDWQKQHLLGTAELTLRPYFYASQQLVLDAKGFDIHSIQMKGKELTYDYDNRKLKIELDRQYQSSEEYSILIKYTAKPNELNVKGSEAISDAKGLYFINPLGQENKPQQIWTQGETESSSCWFPTIDKPNERMTQNIAIRVKDEFVTLSNGLLVKSVKHDDGTRTDYWQQKLGHTPYLAMMAVGDFNITKDQWKDLEVSYYLEDDYHPFARDIFGRTPKMITYFSEILGVDYPWEKYAQIVVRDFVSGAMENTTAVIHGEFVQMNDRELLDNHQDDIIAHELFHHWFGDLVTCESWANLPLNESFATYGEYIWREKEFGRMAADMHLENDLQSYLNEARSKQVDMIRFDYQDKENMFDNHSYAKGGRILHMLRYYLGDQAFYAGLQKYLQDNAFSTVEIHQLRLAMEDICGEDLNWFFNQWFLASGHPVLVIDYNYNSTKKEQEITIEQIQDLSTTPLYKLSFYIDVYENGQPKRHSVTMTQKKQSYTFQVGQKPNNVIVDAEHVLLAQIFDEKEDEWWLEQLNGPLYMDSKMALENISIKNSLKAVQLALNHSFWDIQRIAIKKAAKLSNKTEVVEKIEQIARHNTNSKCRAEALSFLSELEENKKYVALFEEAINHQSLLISAAGLSALAKADSPKALSIAPKHENDLSREVAKLYSLYAGPEKMDYFEQSFEKASGYDLYYLSINYTQYLKNQELNFLLEGIEVFATALENSTSWMFRVRNYLFRDISNAIELKLKKEKDSTTKERAKEWLLTLEQYSSQN